MINILVKIAIHIQGKIKGIKSFFEKKARKKHKDQHQLTSTTNMNRYPIIFNMVKSLINRPYPRILSFGCSTGEECFSLREYFLESNILGADINIKNLNKARMQNTDSKIIFILSNHNELKKYGPYDIIFVMSVLCRWEDTKYVDDCKDIYPFSKFNDSINHLVNALNKDGLMVVYNSNFKVEDSSAATQLTPLDIESITESGFVHKFDSNNNKIEGIHNKVIYKKK